MARIYPKVETEFNHSYGEKQVFEAFAKLPDDWYVFHSVKWAAKRRAGNVTWGEADFVVLNQRFGILVLEVKSGQISCREGIFRQKCFDGSGQEVNIAPFAQADRSKYKIIEELSKRGLADRCFVDKAVWFPSVDDDFYQVNLPMNCQRELILTARDLENPLRALERIFVYYNSPEYTDLSDEDMETILQVLIPEFDLIPAFSAMRDEVGFYFDQLTNEQKKILDFVEDQDNISISGAAGTGKTFVAVERARRLGRNGARVLFLCFNRQLRDYLDAQNTEQNIKFYTLHQLLGEQGMLPDLDESLSVELLQDFSFAEQDYKYCIIDEAQDFDGELLESMIEIAQREGVGVSVFYDKNQLVIKNVLPRIIGEFDCKLTLKQNCRNTIRIMEASNASINLPPNAGQLSTLGTMPTLYFATGRDVILRGIAERIKRYRQEGFDFEDITILTLGTTGNSILAGLRQIGSCKLSERREKGKVQFTTARKFKGLESECVMIVDYDLHEINDYEESKLFYVAASRAKQKLDIFTTADLKTISDVGEKIQGPFGFLIRLSNFLKVNIEGLA